MSVVDIGILSSIPPIGHELRFLIDIKLSIFLRLIPKKFQSTLIYLRLINNFRHLFTNIFKITMEDRRAVYDERINNNRNIVQLFFVDISYDTNNSLK